MKKFMIAAAAAVLATGVYASGTQEQVYDVKLTLKTTVCKGGKVAKGYLTSFLDYEKGQTFAYRAQGTRTILGLLWGCGCDEAFAGDWGVSSIKKDVEYYYGNLFWDKKTEQWVGDTFDSTEVEFKMIHRIGKTAKQVEMVWTLAVNPGEDEEGDGELTAAGFGTIVDVIKTDKESGEDTTCESYIKSASGNVAGILPGSTGDETDCLPCADGEPCEPWAFCVCADGLYMDNAENAAASGTWSIKYNKTLVTAMKKYGKISKAKTKIPSALKEELVAAGE